jgi:hypothetical protein
VLKQKKRTNSSSKFKKYYKRMLLEALVEVPGELKVDFFSEEL